MSQRKGTVAIEFTERHIKIVQVKQSLNKRTVTRLSVEPVAEPTDGAVIQTLKAMIRRTPLLRKDVVVSVPRRYVILRQVRLPSNDAVEIQKMVGLQVGTQLPYAQQDVVVNHKVLAQTSDGHSTVLIMALHKDVYQRYAGILSASGLSIQCLSLSSFGVLGWVQQQGAAGALWTKSSAAVLCMDSTESELCFGHHEDLYYARCLKAGSQDLAQGHTEDLIRHLSLSFDAYKRERMGPDVRTLVIVTDHPEGPAFAHTVQDVLGISVQCVTAQDNIPGGRTVAKGIANFPGISFCAVLGHALVGVSSQMNLVPAEFFQQRAHRLQKGQWIMTSVCMLLVLGLAAGAAWREVLVKEQTRQRLKSQYADLKSSYVGAKKTLDRIKVFKEAVDGQTFLPDVFRRLVLITPAEISFRSLTVDRKGLLTLQGYALSQAGLNNFQALLVKEEVFGDVYLTFATKRKVFNQELTDFKITCQMAGDHDDK